MTEHTQAQASEREVAIELVSNYRKAVVEWCQTQTEEDFGRMVAEQKALVAALASRSTEPGGEALQDYAVALSRAIEYHCHGQQVPESVAARCPHHARMLDGALASTPPPSPAPTQPPAAQAPSDACQWCCGTGRFSDHACRFCQGLASPQPASPAPAQALRSEPEQGVMRLMAPGEFRAKYLNDPEPSRAVKASDRDTYIQQLEDELQACLAASLAKSEPSSAVKASDALSLVERIARSTYERGHAPRAMKEILKAVESAKSEQRSAVKASEPVLWASPEQVEAFTSDPAGDHGHYLPMRRKPAGKFTQPLYASVPKSEPRAPVLTDRQRKDLKMAAVCVSSEDEDVLSEEDADRIVQMLFALAGDKR